MLYEDFYNMIPDPLDQDHIIDDILDAYDPDKYNFYEKLVKSNNKKEKKIKGKHNTIYENALYTLLFGIWKKSLEIFASKEENKGIALYPIAKELTYYLKDKTPKTKDEVERIINGQETTDSSIKNALQAARFDRISTYHWEHCDSSLIVPGNHDRTPINHRLYINCDSTYIDLIAYEFIKKCSERKLKFYFKFDKGSGSRNDTIVFYSDKDHLIPYMNILEEIKKEKNLSSHLHRPPLLTAKINNWIGYGSEPYLTGEESFNSLRIKHLKTAINQETDNCIKSSFNKFILKDGKKISYEQYLIKDIVDYIIDSWHVTDNTLANMIKKEVYQRRNDIINYYKNKQEFNTIHLTYNIRNIYFGKYDLDKYLNRQIKFFRRSIPDFDKRLKNTIKETSELFGISDNYAIDTYIVDTFKNKKVVAEKPKVKVKTRTWTPMTDEEIMESRKKLGLK